MQSEEKTVQVTAEKDKIAQQAHQDIANLNDRLKSANDEITQYKTQLNQYKTQLNRCNEDNVKLSSEKEKALEDICSLNVKLADASKEISVIKSSNAVSFSYI